MEAKIIKSKRNKITALEAFPNWCIKHDIDLNKCNAEQKLAFFLYFNARCAELHR